MLADRNFIGDGAGKAGLDLGQALFFADGKIVALVDALGREEVFQNRDDGAFPAFQAEAGDLKAEVIGEFVDGEAGKAVCLAEDDAAGIGKAEGFARLPRGCNAAAEEIFVDVFCFVAREDADGDLGLGIEKAAGGELQAVVQNVDDAAVGAGVVGPVEFVFENQRLAGADVWGFAAAQAYIGIGPVVLLFVGF